MYQTRTTEREESDAIQCKINQSQCPFLIVLDVDR